MILRNTQSHWKNTMLNPDGPNGKTIAIVAIEIIVIMTAKWQSYSDTSAKTGT